MSKAQFNVRIPADQVREMQSAAESLNVSLGSMTEILFRQFLGLKKSAREAVIAGARRRESRRVV